MESTDPTEPTSERQPAAKSTENAPNPFYAVLVVVGFVFVVTCCAYAVTTIQQMDASRIAESRQSGLVRIMEQHGLTMLIVELVLLTICTFAAISTDNFWIKLQASKTENANRDQSTTGTGGGNTAQKNASAD